MANPDGAEVSGDLLAALRADAEAERAFIALPPSHRVEYLKWIGEAKKPETRARRVSETIARLRRGR
jgi:uncharacterized protein YdeI (YjbR/CyaY-like superfamily)